MPQPQRLAQALQRVPTAKKAVKQAKQREAATVGVLYLMLQAQRTSKALADAALCSN
jgi:hypothetical protein